MRPLAPLAATLLALLAAGPALAADPDYDGDGVVAGDCAPLDPAVHPGAPDLPDLAFEDANCDGMDGTPAGGIFLVPSGNDGNPGTQGQPVATLTKAIQLAAAQGKDVYAAVGDYTRADVAGATRNGIGIYGGYQFPSWSRTKSIATTITGTTEGMVVSDATGIELQLVTVQGQNSGVTGSSTYGLRAVRASVALVGATVAAGNGRDGLDRAADTVAPSPPTKAADGGPGQCGVSPGQGGNNGWLSSPKGGAGGNGASSDGDPALPESTKWDGKPGTAGANSSTVGGGVILGGGGGPKGLYGNNTPNNVSGQNGKPGNTGGNGTNGPRGNNSTSSAGEAWAGESGASGTAGTHGSAGGGGGGGAARTGWDWGSGAGGGQGGHGGFAGAGGLGGGAAGGSFAVYASDSTVVATKSTLTAGTGGTGGDGAAGEPGGGGGAPGAGRDVLDCGTTVGGSGAGGTGGSGGNGGAGGGGAGGPSTAFFRAGGSHFAQQASTLTNAGAGGGGASPGNAGLGGAGDVVINGFGSGDFDGDGVADDVDACPTTAAATGCPARPPKLKDTDGDGVPDPYEDDDGDGLRNGLDKCPAEAAPGQADGCPVAPPPPLHLPQPPAEPVKIVATLSFAFARNSATKAIRFTRLKAIRMPAGGAVEVLCKGKKCTRKRWTKAGSGRIALKPFVKRWFPVGTVLEVRLTAPGTIGKVLRYRVTRKGLKKAELCLPPDAPVPQKC
jgi:hypothetical protein